MKNLKRCRTKFGMKEKLTAVVLGTALALGFFGCKHEVQPATQIGTKAPSEEKEVGDIVFTDGSATPYTEGMTLTDSQKNAAIAIIYYKGNKLNSDYYDPEDSFYPWGDENTETVRTLGVGLKQNQSYSIKWATDESSAYINALNDSKVIEQIQSVVDIGWFWCDKNGSDNLESVSEWLVSNSYEDDTNNADHYPVFYFAKNYKNTATNIAGTQFAGGWYIPSRAEIYEINAFDKFDLNAALDFLGGDKFIKNGDQADYWTSNSDYEDFNYVYCYNFEKYPWGARLPVDDWKANVCCIREF